MVDRILIARALERLRDIADRKTQVAHRPVAKEPTQSAGASCEGSISRAAGPWRLSSTMRTYHLRERQCAEGRANRKL